MRPGARSECSRMHGYHLCGLSLSYSLSGYREVFLGIIRALNISFFTVSSKDDGEEEETSSPGPAGLFYFISIRATRPVAFFFVRSILSRGCKQRKLAISGDINARKLSLSLSLVIVIYNLHNKSIMANNL